MSQDPIYNYLNDYFRNCLGAKEILLPVQIETNEKLFEKYDLEGSELERASYTASTPQRCESENNEEDGTFQAASEETSISEVLFVRIKPKKLFEKYHIRGLELERASRTPSTSQRSESENNEEDDTFQTASNSNKGQDSYLKSLSLEEQPRALELFNKLRQAMNLNSSLAPYIELSSENLIVDLAPLRSKAHRIILMMDDKIEMGEDSDDNKDWIIPDPVVLELQPGLKRPTWELLKKWMEKRNHHLSSGD